MKLSILSLLAIFACVLAAPAPAPRPDGPVESVFHMFSGLPQTMISGANRMLGRIPVVNTVPRVMQGGMNIGHSVAQNMDYVMGAGGQPQQHSGNRPSDSDRSDSRPAPQRREGTMERMYKMMSGLPQAITSGASRMMGWMPLVNNIPRMMQSGINMGGNVARSMDNVMGGFMGGGRGRRSEPIMNRSAPTPRSGESEKLKKEEKEEKKEEKKEENKPTKPADKKKETKDD